MSSCLLNLAAPATLLVVVALVSLGKGLDEVPLRIY